MFLHANVVRVKEGKNNKTFSDKRKPFKWQGEKRRFGEAFIKGKKCTSARRTQHTFHIHTVVCIIDGMKSFQDSEETIHSVEKSYLI